MVVRVFAVIVAAVSRLLGTMSVLRRDERGEGVISVAIAVLIVALIGGALWVAFDNVTEDAAKRASEAINAINTP